ncbi:MAG: leucine-rich repeat protein, partial [Oscillospiraceae bacterium]|nr:leucine-rich repeat protein [Oscillospiraceae bacterium]
MKRKIIGIALLCALCLTLLPAALLIPVRAADGGDFGGSFHWSFADGTLTVTGSGAMEEYLGEDLPWSAHMSEIETVKIGEGITLLGGGAFDGCRTLKKAVLPKSLLEIGAYAFRSCGLLSDINFPSKLQKIGTQAFTSCGSLPKTVKLPDSITDMGTGVFTGCPFTSFTLPLGMDYVSAELLYGCSALSEVKLHDGVRTIKARAFSLCTGLTEFHFPKNISLVGDEAFYKCTGLREIRVPAGVYSLEGGVFSGCTGLTSVVLEEGITSLNYGVFAECTGLKEITLPDSLGSVGYYTFLDCKNLERLTLSSGTAFVHAEALYGCSNLKEIAVPASNPYLSAYDGVLYKGDKLIKAPCALAKERVAVKPGTVAIGDQAFEGCAGIREITLPDSLRTIGYAAFNGCSKLGSVTIPDGVTTIQQSSFTDCSSLKSVSLPGSLTQIERGAFGGGLTSAVLRGTHDEILSMIIGAGNEGLIRAYINGGNAPYHTCAVQPVTDGNSYYWRIAFYNEPMGPLPIPEKQGYRFEGWYTARNGAGERVTEDTVLTLDVSLPLYANWVRARTIGVVACGGKNRGPEYYRITEAEGWALGELPAEPERPGWRFLGWYTAAQGGERVEPGRVFEADCYIYAHWERTQYAETVSDG